MARNRIVALVAAVLIGLAVPTVAFARGGGGGGGHGGGGFGGGGGFHGGGGGFHGGGFAGGGFHGGGFHGGGLHNGFHGRRFVGGFGFYGPYGYDDTPYYDDYTADDGGCYLVRRRVHTHHGWRVRRVEVCG